MRLSTPRTSSTWLVLDMGDALTPSNPLETWHENSLTALLKRWPSSRLSSSRKTQNWLLQNNPPTLHLALSTASNSSAPGISRIGYKILKWAHSIRPDALTLLFNLCLESGTHPWKHAKVVVINKPNKPDYSLLKAYHPISLLECTGKLLEKVVTKRFNWDIKEHRLIPMTQFGSHPKHNAVDVVATLVH